MTTRNHLNDFEKIDPEITEELSRTAAELLEVEHLDQENTKYLASVLFTLGRYEEAMEKLEGILSMNGDDGEILGDIAICHFRRKDFRTSLKYLKRSLETDPENEMILSYSMLSYEFLDEYENAAKCAEKILRNDPKNSQVIRRLIDYHLELKNYDKCVYYLDLAEYKDREKKALVLYESGRYEECIAEARHAGTPEAYRLAGRSYLKLQNTSKAVRYLYRSYEKDPNVDILLEISEIYFEANDYPKSIHFLKRVLLHDESNVEVYSMIASAHYHSSNWLEAIEYAEKALEISKKAPQAYVTLADAHFQLGANFEKALEVLDEAISENPESAELWVKKGGYSYPHDMYGFRESYEKAISLNPCDCSVYREYIYLLLMDDETEDAKIWYNQMILFNPLFEKSFEELQDSMFL